MHESVEVKAEAAAPFPEANGHFVASLGRLTSFNHARCDAILHQRNITIVGAYQPEKGSAERDTVYVGFAYLVFWFTVMASVLRESRLPENRGTMFGQVRHLAPFFVLMGLFCFALQLHAAAEYADVCSKLVAPK